MSNSEQLDAFDQLQLHEHQMRKDGSLSTKALELFGATVKQDSPLLATMGEFGPDFYQRLDDFKEREKKLASEKKKPAEIDRLLKHEYDEKIKGTACLYD